MGISSKLDALVVALSLCGCGSTPAEAPPSGAGGAPIASGGKIQAGTNSGGKTSGGIMTSGVGNASDGGMESSGGSLQLGGAQPNGGMQSMGGLNPSPGGALNTEGAKTGVGGSAIIVGGSANSGGSKIVGGMSGANGGMFATGGIPFGGGTSGAGGNGSTGGGIKSGGTNATGGTSPTGGGTSSGPWPPSSTFKNPVLWEDLADLEVIRVDDTYYYTASTMHYSPGAPILRSYDLVNWEYVGHAVPVLDFGAKYDLNGGNAYVKGIYASSLRYRKSNKTFYWIGCINGGGGGFVYTATAPEGPWQKHSAGGCYYDVGLLIDDDDTMYVAYGNTNISVAQLSADGFSQVKAKQVYTSSVTLEGSRFYKINGNYYILVTRPADGEFVLKASSPFGPYTIHTFLDKIGTPISGGGVPHQGGLVDTQNGDWYYMAFIDAYPGGRVPALAPITWGTDGWPTLQLVNNAWGASYPYPNLPRPPRETKPLTGIDSFSGTALSPEWEWNHNPDNTKWSLDGGLKLQTATVTTDLYEARNTLTHRILGPQSTATIQMDISAMRDGDLAGLALLRDSSAWVGIKKASGAAKVAMVNGLTMDSNWNTTRTGTEVTSTAVSVNTIWLRIAADIRPGSNSQGKFSYSTDGVTFTSIGSGFVMNNAWQFFMGYRFAIFNFATQAVGGAVSVSSFELKTP